MSRLANYRRLEQQIAQHTQRLQALKDDPELQTEIEFETRLKTLLQEHGKGLADVIAIIGSGKTEKPATSAPRTSSRRPRQVKVYRNPLTGEIVESKGGNNKLLGEWKAQFGHKEVESWVQTP
jgi:hypothetical protein